MLKKQSLESEHGKILFSWSFPENLQQKRSTSWYVFIILITLGLLVYSTLTANFLFALIIILTIIILFFSAKKESLEIKFKITEDGLAVGNNFYGYKDIKKFWIIYEPPEVKNLYFEFKSFINPRLSIPLNSENPLGIRKKLLDYLEEDLDKDSESISDYLKRTLKF